MERISKSQWAVIFENMVQRIEEGIVIVDAWKQEMPIIFVNKGFTEITGFNPEDVMGKNPKFLQGKDTNPKAVNRIRRCIAEGKNGSVNLLNYRKDGSEFWNHFSITPVRNDKGEVTYWIGILRDITAMVHFIEAKSQNKSMTTTINTMNDMVNNFLNSLLYLRDSIEDHDNTNKPDEKILKEFDYAFDLLKKEFLRLCNIEQYKEKKLKDDFSILDFE